MPRRRQQIRTQNAATSWATAGVVRTHPATVLVYAANEARREGFASARLIATIFQARIRFKTWSVIAAPINAAAFVPSELLILCPRVFPRTDSHEDVNVRKARCATRIANARFVRQVTALTKTPVTNPLVYSHPLPAIFVMQAHHPIPESRIGEKVIQMVASWL